MSTYKFTVDGKKIENESELIRYIKRGKQPDRHLLRGEE